MQNSWALKPKYTEFQVPAALGNLICPSLTLSICKMGLVVDTTGCPASTLPSWLLKKSWIFSTFYSSQVISTCWELLHLRDACAGLDRWAQQAPPPGQWLIWDPSFWQSAPGSPLATVARVGVGSYQSGPVRQREDLSTGRGGTASPRNQQGSWCPSCHWQPSCLHQEPAWGRSTGQGKAEGWNQVHTLLPSTHVHTQCISGLRMLKHPFK